MHSSESGLTILFLDMPPVGVVADAAICKQLCRRVCFVVRTMYKDLGEIRKSNGNAAECTGKIAGFVLNDVEGKMIRIIHMENMAMITEAGITNNERAP